MIHIQFHDGSAARTLPPPTTHRAHNHKNHFPGKRPQFEMSLKLEVAFKPGLTRLGGGG